MRKGLPALWGGVIRVCTFACLLALSFAFRAEAQLLSVKAEPRWPWNGLVDITVSVPEGVLEASGSGASVYLRLYGYDKDRDANVDIRTFSSDGGANFVTHPAQSAYPLGASGIRKFVWNAAQDYPTFNSSSFTVKAELSKGVMKYRVIDLATNEIWGTESEPDLTDDACRTTQLWMRRIPAGTFMMGSPENEDYRQVDYEQLHQVTLSQGFYIGIFELTQKQFKLIAGYDAVLDYYGGDLSYAQWDMDDARPVLYLSYEDIRGSVKGLDWPNSGHAVDEGSFLATLRAKTGGLAFDLPTEAQWEYACRAGTTTPLNSGKYLTDPGKCPNVAEVARYMFNEDFEYYDGKGGFRRFTRVGYYLPNNWGLYDMHGNVREWCLDRWKDFSYSNNYSSVPVTDPVGRADGDLRIVRGGGFYADEASHCRSAIRFTHNTHQKDGDYVGIRLVCPY